MTEPEQKNWKNLIRTHGGQGFFPRQEAERIVPREELNHLIHLGLVLELGSCIEIPESVKQAS